VGHDVACRDLADPRLLPVEELDGGQLDGDVVFVTDAYDDQAAAAVSHRGEIAGQIPPLLIGVAVAVLLEVEVGVLANAAGD
jgi:hypothetical protein